jgi:Predicted nucleotide-binding protein containing TIR-like domain
MTKPALFIGSSSEGIAFARAVRDLLTQDAEVTVWNEGFFGLGSVFIETLVNALPRFDFAVLVLTPDDLMNSRDVEMLSPRDNILFELGLFMGRLGRSRTFIVHQLNAKLKIPSDLSGVTTATFEWPREDNSYRSAVGAACDSIREVIRDLGVSETKTAKAITDIKTRQDEQQSEIRSLQIALQGIVTQYELDKLTGLNNESSFLCYYSDDLANEIRRLRAMGFVKNQNGAGLRDIIRGYKGKNRQFDLKQYFHITNYGQEYLKLRSEIMQNMSEVNDK